MLACRDRRCADPGGAGSATATEADATAAVTVIVDAAIPGRHHATAVAVMLHHQDTTTANAYATAASSRRDARSSRRHNWDDPTRIAPLATPETLSEASSSPPSPVVPAPRPMRRTPKIPGNLSTAADDLKNNLHYAMLSARNYFLRTGETHAGSNNGSSSGNSEASYESAKSLAAAGLPPPVPRRRDSVIVRREQRTCTAACCTDDLSENSSTRTSSHSSRNSRISHRIQVEFNEEENDTNGSSLDFYEAKGSSGQRDSSNDVFLSVRSSPECKGLMAPATDLGAEWKKRFDPATGVSGDASLPLLRGLSPTPTTGQHSSPFFNAKRKKYVYPITLVGRGESSV